MSKNKNARSLKTQEKVSKVDLKEVRREFHK